MSKDLSPFTLSLARCERDLEEFKALLDGKAELSESKDIRPFFLGHRDLAAMAGAWNTQIHEIDRVLINNHKITCITFDELHDFISKRIRYVRSIADRGDLS